MKQASLIIGIFAIVGMCIGFIPCLGWFNWFNIPLAIVGIILGALAYNEQRNIEYRYDDPMIRRNNDVPIGLILCSVAFVFGAFRLVIGLGVF